MGDFMSNHPTYASIVHVAWSIFAEEIALHETFIMKTAQQRGGEK